MFTYASRAVARRVMTNSRRIAVSARLHVSHGSNVTRVVAVRGFSSSQWRRLVAKSVESTADSTQKATKVAKKKTTTTAAGAVKKTTIEKKVIATKKAVKPKPKPKPKKVKAVLTPEQKKEREDKLKLKELKQLSLMSQQPTLKPNRSWSVFVAENHGRIEGELTFLDKVQELKGEWQAMPESEKQRYASIAAVNAEDNKKALKEWTQSFSVEEIILANRARVQLKHIKKGAPKLADDRVPKMPATAMARFLALHLSSQPGQAQSRDDRQYTFKSAVDAWRELPDEQKKPFIDSYEQEIAVYKDLRAPLLELVRQKQKEVKDSLKTSK